MTQGFPAQPQFGAPPQQYAAPQQGYAPPQPQYPQPAPAPQPGGFFQVQDPHMQAAGQVPPQQMAPQSATPADTSAFFGGAASISFDAQKGYVKGTPRGGQVLDKKISNQTKMGTGELLTWQDGSYRKQMVVTLQTSERNDPQDDGKRDLFIKGDLPRATREALQAVGAQDVEIGGWLYAAWIDEKPAKAAGYNPQKIYKAVYARPGSPDPMAGQPGYQPVPNAPVPVPQPSAGPEHFAAYAQQQTQGPIAAMPQQHAAAVNGMYQQAMQMDPALAAQAGQPPQTGGFPAQQFAPSAPQPGQFPAQPQPGAQPPNFAGAPQQPQQPTPQGQPPAEWVPFAP
jgi:hypothetical protein